MALGFDRLINPTTVANVGPAALRRLVSNLAPDLVIPRATESDDVAALANWLRSIPPEEHSALFERLHTVIHLLDQRDLQQSLTNRRIPLSPDKTLGETVIDLAISTPNVLDELSAQASVAEAHSAKAFVTYGRVGAASPVPKLTPEILRKVEDACRHSLEDAGHGRYCRIWQSIDGRNTALVIAYAAGLRSKRVISRADAAELQTNRSPRDAVVLLARDGRELRVSAGSSHERDFLTTAIASGLFGEGARFESAAAFDLEVICKRSFAKKLQRLTGNDFASVTLIDLLLVRHDDLRTRITLRSRDVLALAEEQGLDLGQFEPKRAVFEFVPAERRGRRRWRIELKGSDTRKCTAPWSNDSVDGILAELGIVHREPS